MSTRITLAGALVLLSFFLVRHPAAQADDQINIQFPAGETKDAVFGLENPTWQDWHIWYSKMLLTRQAILFKNQFDSSIYRDPAQQWSNTSYRQFYIFIYDSSFYADGRYRTEELIQKIKSRFGYVDSVLLWHAYPQIGFDNRNQYDFYTQMPGGLEGLRREVSDVLHRNGIRVFVNFNPWAVEDGDHQAAYKELARIVKELDADGVMLDTLNNAPRELKAEIDRAKEGVVLSTERRLPDSDLSLSRQSWAQWYDIGNFDRPTVYRHKWLVPNHMQFAIRRWDTEKLGDIVYSFFNASAFHLWENIFSSWNPISASDRKLLAETGIVLQEYGPWIANAKWQPLIPTGQKGLDANRWIVPGRLSREVLLFRNRTAEVKTYTVPAAPLPFEYFAFWGPNSGRVLTEGEAIEIAPYSTQALVLDDEEHFQSAYNQFVTASATAALDDPWDVRTPLPQRVIPQQNSKPVADLPSGFAKIDGGTFKMTIEHKRRETGCTHWGSTPSNLWGWYYEDPISHQADVTVKTFALKKTAVTNAEYLRFVRESGYQPRDTERFLLQIPRNADGSLPDQLVEELAPLPVTHVTLADARAYAAWKGERLPTEEEWQWAAEGAGLGNLWPWGSQDGTEVTVNLTGKLVPAESYLAGATPQGVLNLSGNVWEFTESEWSDGHSDFVFLRGGVFMPSHPSEWIIPRGPRPNRFHAKYLMMSDGLARSETVGFRTAVDLAP